MDIEPICTLEMMISDERFFNSKVFCGVWHISEQARFLGFGFTFLEDKCLYFFSKMMFLQVTFNRTNTVHNCFFFFQDLYLRA